MPTRRIALVDAFSTEPLAGNAAGVVPDADGLTDQQCQAVARELSVSETAFVFESEEADRRVRFFTPTQEVDLCGHATLARMRGSTQNASLQPALTHSKPTSACSTSR